MKKWIVGSVAAVLFFAFISAAHAWHTERQDIEYTGKQVFSAPVEVKSDFSFGGTKLTATAAELNAVADGVTASASDLNTLTSWYADWAPASVATDFATTNGEVVAVSAPLVVVTPSGQANGFTNTVTVANPPAAGFRVTIAVATSSNLLAIADSGNVSLASAFEGNTGDTLTLIGVSTSAWLEVGRSAN